MTTEEKLKQMGIELPSFGAQSYYGATYRKMRPFHRTGNLLVLSGHVPDLTDGRPLPGRVGAEVTVEQAYAARSELIQTFSPRSAVTLANSRPLAW